MRKGLGRAIVLATLLGVLLVGAACNRAKKNPQVNQLPGGMEPGMGGPWGMNGSPGLPSTPIRQAMTRLAKGPQSLQSVISQELQTDAPPWETIGPQAKEYAELAASLSKYDPPRGSKESWAALTGSYAQKAADLKRAATSRDRSAALAAHAALTNSCKECHREHRQMGPGGKMGPMSFGPPGE
jgi:hypothetical protein